jgi:hypothetical protein
MKKFLLYHIIYISSIFGQFSVTGKISDRKSRTPLPGSNVLLIGTNLGAAADADGNFEIKNVPEGSYEIMATFIGYENFRSNISVNASSASSFENIYSNTKCQKVVMLS